MKARAWPAIAASTSWARRSGSATGAVLAARRARRSRRRAARAGARAAARGCAGSARTTSDDEQAIGVGAGPAQLGDRPAGVQREASTSRRRRAARPRSPSRAALRARAAARSGGSPRARSRCWRPRRADTARTDRRTPKIVDPRAGEELGAHRDQRTRDAHAVQSSRSPSARRKAGGMPGPSGSPSVSSRPHHSPAASCADTARTRARPSSRSRGGPSSRSRGHSFASSPARSRAEPGQHRLQRLVLRDPGVEGLLAAEAGGDLQGLAAVVAERLERAEQELLVGDRLAQLERGVPRGEQGQVVLVEVPDRPSRSGTPAPVRGSRRPTPARARRGAGAWPPGRPTPRSPGWRPSVR